MVLLRHVNNYMRVYIYIYLIYLSKDVGLIHFDSTDCWEDLGEKHSDKFYNDQLGGA